MFVNEYVMTRKRYDKWAVPKFWRLPIFYVYCAIFASGTFGWIYFRSFTQMAVCWCHTFIYSHLSWSIFQMDAR